MDKEERDKFEPLTKVKPSFDVNQDDEINLKEKEPLDEPRYLEDKTLEEIEQPKTKLKEEPETQKEDQESTPHESTANYAQFSKEDKSKRNYKKPLLIILGLLIIGGGAAYWFILKPKPAPSSSPATSASSSATSTSTETTTPATSALTKITSTTKSYTSPNFSLSFSYPDDWVIVDAGGGSMTVKSPSIQLKNTAGQTVAGQIVFTIRSKAQKLPEFDSGNSTATRDSLKIAYTKPTQTQRGNTYVSFLQYATSRATGSLDGLYITGDNGYTKAQAIPLVDVQKVDPIISISFIDASSKQLSIADSMMDDTVFAGSLTGILKSLSIN